MGKVFLGLVHYPIYNKRMEIISTSVTNLDIHDIARTVTTYGLEKYYLIHPLPTQQAIIKEILITGKKVTEVFIILTENRIGESCP